MVSGIFLIVFLVGMFALASKIQLAKAQSTTIYINSDGSVSPSGVPISIVENITYTFTNNMSYPTYNGIVVERNNIVIEGNGYTVQGSYSDSGTGLGLTDISNVTIKNTNIEGFQKGIFLSDSNNNTVIGNNVTASELDGIYLYSSSNNTLYHNNFINNTSQVVSLSSTNTWDNGYPSGGNYWSDYNGTDLYSGQYQNVTGSDGIGDTPYVIDANNTDHYPLMNQVVITEFQPFLLLPLFIVVTLLIVAIHRKKSHRTTPQNTMTFRKRK